MPYLRDFSLLFWYNESIKIKAVFPMMTQNADKKREQIQMFCMDDLVPQDHLLRLIDQAIDWSFIYDLVIDKYSGRHIWWHYTKRIAGIWSHVFPYVRRHHPVVRIDMLMAKSRHKLRSYQENQND